MNQAAANAQSVRHDLKAQAFLLSVEDEEVTLRYRRPDDRTIDFYSTYTPQTLRGRGLARLVVNAGLDYARQQQLNIIPSCSYVAKILERESQTSADR